MDLPSEVLDEWINYEYRLKKVIFYIKEKIEFLEHNWNKNFSFIEILMGLQYCMEFNSILGDFKKEINQEIITRKGLKKNTPEIIGRLEYYKSRLEKDIFTNFFPRTEEKIFNKSGEEVKKKFYSIYPYQQVPTKPYFGSGSSALEVLIWKRVEREFHLENPRSDVINVSQCPYFKVHGGYGESYRCTYPWINNHFCVLSLSPYREDCPNIKNLVKKEDDFFRQIIKKIPSPNSEDVNSYVTIFSQKSSKR